MNEPTAAISQESLNKRAADLQPPQREQFQKQRTTTVFNSFMEIAKQRSPEEALQQAAELAVVQEFRAEDAEKEMVEAYNRAEQDSLTGLLNRAGFERHAGNKFKRNIRKGKPNAVIRIDIDDFKQFNEKNGHEGGDDALIEVSKILMSAVRTDDPIARYGGDEFEIFLDNADSSSSIKVVKRIMAYLAMSQNRKYPDLKFSMGIAMAEAGDTLDSLKRKSDSAAIALKRAGKNGIGFWGVDDPEIQQKTREQFRGPVLKDANVSFTSTLISSDE